jgi:molecular chaperone DnaJ
VYQSVKETVNIPKGVDNNVNLRVSKKGNHTTAGPPGDLIISVKVKPHQLFRRDGADIHSDLYISVSQVRLMLSLIK